MEYFKKCAGRKDNPKLKSKEPLHVELGKAQVISQEDNVNVGYA